MTNPQANLDSDSNNKARSMVNPVKNFAADIQRFGLIKFNKKLIDS